MTDSTPRRRARSTGPSRSGAVARTGRGSSRGRTGRPASSAGPDAQGIGQTPAAGNDASGVGWSAPRPPRTGPTPRPAGKRPGTAPPATPGRRGRRRTGVTVRGLSRPAETKRSASQLVKQVAVLGLVFCAVALALAVPLRNYLTQRADLGAEVSTEQKLRVQLAALEEERAALTDPAYIAAEAKRRLQYVKPGDTVFVVNAPALPKPKAASPVTPGTAAPWYSHLWDTLSDPTVTKAPGPAPTSGSTAPTTAPSAPAAAPGKSTTPRSSAAARTGAGR
ncbi:Septum formation initiator [Nakamurella panacisegetis]|uniref:Septum formation initiator n=1 Tax=Nakamurella panacisegetis TaxID=1090615 RepID=A0A1H0IHB1_9ACTN|nr:septum formation initiator family protein [Nakamurella panacisegetis]SDO30814.1 Septum formation initiator [Nakamurella panacisegetis]